MSVAVLPRRRSAAAVPLDLIAALPLPVVVLDDGGAVVLANAAAETLLNASQAALCERGLAAVLATGEPLLELIAAVRADGSDVVAYGREVGVAGGRVVRADVFVTPLSEAPGWIMVSLQARPTAALIDRRQSGQGAARSAIRIAAMLAHEIKNPLSGIRGAAQLIAQGGDDDGELTDLVCREVDRIAALIDRMENFTDTRPLAIAAVNIHEVLDHVRRLAATGCASGIPIHQRYDPSLPAVAGNRDALVQVFLNLIKNAAAAVIAAGGSSGSITLTTAFRHGLRVGSEGSSARVALPLEICVVDTGFGPPADVAAHLFEPFVSTRPGGGLGLALVAKIVGDHGGIVELERAAAPPRTVLRVLLPAA